MTVSILFKHAFATFALLSITACATGDGTSEPDTGEPEPAAGCSADDVEASTGPCLVAQLAGTYDVTATSGVHTRGTLTVDDDGAVHYDDGLDFLAADMEGVYDRLECCQRISVEMVQRDDNDTTLAEDARHRVDFFVDDTALPATVTDIEYHPNWPSEDGKVVLTVD